MIKYADYIHSTNSFPTWNVAYCIDTGIYAAVDCEIRIIYQGTGANVDRIAGFANNEVGGGASDSTDFRLFYYFSGSLDVWNSRRSNLKSGGIVVSGTTYDYTFGNFYCIDNLTQTTIFTGTTTSMNTNCTIKVDVGGTRIARIQIKNGGVVVFDGYAAVDTSNNTVGLYDKVSSQMFTNSSLTMTYDNILTTFSITPETIDSSATGGTFNLDIETETPWSAAIGTDWITLSANSGETSGTITVTVPYNQFNERTGIVLFSNTEDELTLTITQNANTLIPIMKIYRNGNRIN